MSYVMWKERAFRVGVRAFDDEHREIADALNDLCRAVADSDDASIQARFREVERRTRQHFDHEERLMRRYRYPHYREHKRAHDGLLLDLERTRHRLHFYRDHDISLFLVAHFSYWMLGHALTMDALYTPFFAKHLIMEGAWEKVAA